MKDLLYLSNSILFALTLYLIFKSILPRARIKHPEVVVVTMLMTPLLLFVLIKFAFPYASESSSLFFLLLAITASCCAPAFFFKNDAEADLCSRISLVILLVTSFFYFNLIDYILDLFK